MTPLFSSVQFSCSVMSNSLWPHGLQHTRPPCPSPTPGVYSNSCPLTPWFLPTISSSVIIVCIYEVQFSRSVMTDCDPKDCSNPCPGSLSITTPGAYSKSCPSSRWCHPTVSSSVIPFSSCLPSIRVFSMSQFFASGGQNIRASASESVLPMNIQDWFPLGVMGLISLQSNGLSRVFSNTMV